MSSDGVEKTEATNMGRRRFLTVSTAVVGAVGAGFVAVPFIGSWMPSKKALAAGAPVEADISKLEMGQAIKVEWRGKSVIIVRRSEETIATLTDVEDKLLDPNSEETAQQPAYALNQHRSINKEYLVLLSWCTHLGCSPTFTPEVTADWQGGFICPCHGSKFDMAGRVHKSMPAPTNMIVPPHQYLTDTNILIGVDEGEQA
ncbi:MAG: ubiquinol-cytochrome c reductase iron-sulfur subunit [Gammaproteobacteria bacterium]|nr:MAG: ubiquinol-cytochrome c reductase iron-sulfur subunit [Gammaproteobacteria bacterium]